MTKTKSTKRALLGSALALLICVSMLIGSTFAWFTDSVTSGSNVIQSGNLDIDVQYTLDGENWKPLDGADDLFQKGLWEPGHTEVVALKITNTGSLALKYAASMNIINETVGKTKDGKDIVLSDILTVSTLTQQANDDSGFGDVALALAFMGEKSVGYETTTTFKAGNVLGNDVELQPGVAHYVIVKVDMAETVGNEANAKDQNSVPSIEFGINVVATQFTEEYDSFNNQYDALATYMNKNADGEWEIESLGQLIYFAKTVNEGKDYAGETVVLTKDIDLAGLNWKPIGNWDNAFSGTFNGKGNTISNLTIKAPTVEGVGLFGVTQNATIKGVNIKNVDISGYSMVSALVGALYPSAISDCHITGKVNIVAEYAYVAGIAGYCYYGTQVDNCSVVADEMGSIVSKTRNAVGGITAWLLEGDHRVLNCEVKNLNLTGWANIGGITGFVHYSNTIDGCSVENVNITKTRLDGFASIGLISGGYSYMASKAINLTNNTLKNITLNGTAVYQASASYLYGSEYSGTDNSNFVASGNTETGIVNNVVYAQGAVQKIDTATKLQDALNNATTDTVIQLTDNITGNLTVDQNTDARVVIDGNGKVFDGYFVVDGNSATITSAGLTIQNVVFKADSIAADACINLGEEGNNNSRYTCNVTVKNCTFDVPGAVGVKSYTGGDKNLTVVNCTATANAHSLVQVANVDNVVIENCKVYSKNGANFNQSTNVTIVGSTFDVLGYAVRFGASSGATGKVETYKIENCTLKSACAESGDAVIILRGTADCATLTIVNTTIVGTPDIINNAAGASVVK